MHHRRHQLSNISSTHPSLHTIIIELFLDHIPEVTVLLGHHDPEATKGVVSVPVRLVPRNGIGVLGSQVDDSEYVDIKEVSNNSPDVLSSILK